MSNGRRYEKEPKLNIKKIIGVIVAIIVIIMFVISIKTLLNKENSSKNSFNKAYFTAYKDGKWGVIDSQGKEIISFEQEEYITIPNNEKDIFIIISSIDLENETYQTKVLNSKKEQLYTKYNLVTAIDNYDTAGNLWYENNVLKVFLDGKYGLINFNGDEILKCEYDEIVSLKGTNNSLIIKKGENVGLASNTGDVIIKPEYKQITALGEDYKDGYIVVNHEDKKGVISCTKEQLLDAIYEEIENVDLGKLYVVKQDGKRKIINDKKETLLESGFDEIVEINGENIIAKKDGKVGVINTVGEEKIPFIYTQLTPTNNNCYIAQKEELYGIVDLENQEKIPFAYNNIIQRKDTDFIEADKTASQTEIYNKDFELKITGIITKVDSQIGYISVRVEEEQKYYNFKFEEKKASDIFPNHTLFLSKKDGKYGYINKEGQVIVDYIYDDATEQNKYGYCSVKKGNVWGSLNKDGNIEKEPSVDLDNNLIVDFIGSWHLAEDLNMNYYEQM